LGGGAEDGRIYGLWVRALYEICIYIWVLGIELYGTRRVLTLGREQIAGNRMVFSSTKQYFGLTLHG